MNILVHRQNSEADLGEQFASICAKHIKSVLENNSISFYEIKSVDEIKKLKEILKRDKNNDGYLMIFSHGTKEQMFFWQNKEKRIKRSIIDLKDINLLLNKKLILVACKTITLLGKNAVEKCAKYCLGYNDKCYFLPEKYISYKSQAKEFNRGIRRIIEDGISAETAKNETKKGFNEIRKKIYETPDIPTEKKMRNAGFMLMNIQRISQISKNEIRQEI